MTQYQSFRYNYLRKTALKLVAFYLVVSSFTVSVEMQYEQYSKVIK